LLAMVVNDDEAGLAPRGGLRFIASELAPTGSAKAFVGASLLAMVVNDDEAGLTSRGGLRFIASELAPTGSAKAFVGASMLAMVVNDDAGNQTPSGGLGFIASELAPTGSAQASAGAMTREAGNCRFQLLTICSSTTSSGWRSCLSAKRFTWLRQEYPVARASPGASSLPAQDCSKMVREVSWLRASWP